MKRKRTERTVNVKAGVVWEQRELFYTKTEMNLDLRMGSTI